jgi:hypothetical protein
MMKTRSIHQVVKISALLALVLAGLSASAQPVRADIGANLRSLSRAL